MYLFCGLRDYLTAVIIFVYPHNNKVVYGSRQTESQYTKQIQILQNNALRHISFAENFRDHFTLIYEEFNILKHITMENLLLVHDYLNKKLPHCFNDYFTLSRDKYTYSTRAAIQDELFMPNTDTVSYGTNSIKLQSIKSWNAFNRKHPDTDFISLSRSKLK